MIEAFIDPNLEEISKGDLSSALCTEIQNEWGEVLREFFPKCRLEKSDLFRKR